MSILGSTYLETDYIAPSSFSQNGGIVQTVVLNDTTQRSQAFTTNIRGSITGLSATITPRRTDNSILIYARWCGEVSNLWNSVFALRRNGTEIGFGFPGVTNQEYGITCGMDTYSANATDNASTPAQMNFWYRDSPATTSSVTYDVSFLSSSSGGVTLYTNRTITNSNTQFYELPTSSVYLLEVSG